MSHFREKHLFEQLKKSETKPSMLDIRELASILESPCKGPALPYRIEQLLSDSRRAYKTQAAMFVAIHGKNHDGHRYVDKMYQKGVRAFLLENELPSYHPDAYYIHTDSSLKALQKIARFKREQLSYPIMAITGSNGKTVIKEWMYQLFSKQLSVARSPRSYNSQLGVPLAVWNLPNDKELGIIETGISKPGEMEKLEAIVQPEMGLVTNIGEAHAANFTNREHKLREKLLLFKEAKHVFYCKDHTLVHDVMKELYPSKNHLSWSAKGPAFVQLLSVEKHNNYSLLEIQFEATNYRVHLPFIDSASLENFMHCFNIAAFMDLDLQEVSRQAAFLTEVSMRSQILRGQNNTLLINDSYSSDFHSLENAIEILASQAAYPKKSLILSDLPEGEFTSAYLYTEIAEMLRVNHVSRIIGIGHEVSSFSSFFEGLEAEFYPDTEAFVRAFSVNDFRAEAILIKGARSFNLEQITKLLQEKSHSAEMEIRLNGIKHNLEVYRSLLSPQIRIMAMVKAFGYGTGDYEVAQKLEQSGVSYLAVAFTDEGVALRKKGISIPILVLNPEVDGFEALLKYKLEPEVYSLEILKALVHFLSSSHMNTEEAFPIHLNIDTGMHRLGFDEADMEELTKVLVDQRDLLSVRSIFTHLSSAGDADGKEYTLKQLEDYSKAYQQIVNVLKEKPLRHALNTSGMEYFPDFEFDMVRLGIGLYGISSKAEIQNKMESVLSLRARVLQVKKIKKGDAIGYSRAERAKEDMRIATVSLGYADGLRRELSLGKGKLYFEKHPCPIVGNVCMDMCMVAIGELNILPGDKMSLFENNRQIVELAKVLNSIPYEVLSSISSRVKRIYSEE